MLPASRISSRISSLILNERVPSPDWKHRLDPWEGFSSLPGEAMDAFLRGATAAVTGGRSWFLEVRVSLPKARGLSLWLDPQDERRFWEGMESLGMEDGEHDFPLGKLQRLHDFTVRFSREKFLFDLARIRYSGKSRHSISWEWDHDRRTGRDRWIRSPWP